MCVINVDTEILKKISANRIQGCINRIMHSDHSDHSALLFPLGSQSPQDVPWTASRQRQGIVGPSRTSVLKCVWTERDKIFKW